MESEATRTNAAMRPPTRGTPADVIVVKQSSSNMISPIDQRTNLLDTPLTYDCHGKNKKKEKNKFPLPFAEGRKLTTTRSTESFRRGENVAVVFFLLLLVGKLREEGKAASETLSHHHPVMRDALL